MTYTAATVAEVVDGINRRYFLPAIQRPFVWSPEQVVGLFDSLLKGYPISSFLFWDIDRENRTKWKIYKFMENFRFGDVQNELADTSGRDVTLVLDGQQRLTSLLIGLRGSFTVRAKGKRWDNPNAWTRQQLYIDLLVDPTAGNDDDDGEDVEGRYGFAFFEEKPKSSAYHAWFRVGEILDVSDIGQLQQFKESLVRSLPEKISQTAELVLFANLVRLHKAIWTDDTICFYTETQQDYDRVLSIFIRANDSGTPLSRSDLMMSVIVSQWSSIAAREEIYGLVRQINETIDRKNNISKDFVLKACLLLCDIDHKYKVSNFNETSLTLILERWTRIKKALVTTFKILNRFGVDRENLTSLNAVLPIAYYIMKIERNPLDQQTPDNIRNIERIRRWLIASLCNGVFGGASDSTITIARDTLADALKTSGDFPLRALNINLTRHLRRPANLTGDAIDDLLELRYGGKLTFLVLSLLYDEQNWGSVPHHVDHIIPKSLANHRALMAKQLPTSRIEKITGLVDRIGNLQLLTENDNKAKNDAPFDQWVRSRDNGYFARHLIPDDELTWSPEGLPDFVALREKKIRARLEALSGDL